MDSKFKDIDMRTLAERKSAVSAKIRDKMPKDVYESFQKDISTDRIKFMCIAGLLGRDIWEEFWGTYRDSMETEVSELLSKMEDTSKPKDLF